MSRDSTLTALAVPAVLMIACPPEIAETCARALGEIGVEVKTCDFLDAANAASVALPLAIVIPEQLYSFDPEELDELARDVRATLVRVGPSVTVAGLKVWLRAAIEEAAEKREEFARARPSKAPTWPSTSSVPPSSRPDSAGAGRRR